MYRPPFPQEKSFFPEWRGGVCTQARHFGVILCQIVGLFTRICILLQTFYFLKFNTHFSNCLGSWQTSPLSCFHDWTTQKATCDRAFPSYCVVLDKMLHIWLFTLQLLAVPHLFQNTFSIKAKRAKVGRTAISTHHVILCSRISDGEVQCKG